jgi:hypothetical protein
MELSKRSLSIYNQIVITPRHFYFLQHQTRYPGLPKKYDSLNAEKCEAQQPRTIGTTSNIFSSTHKNDYINRIESFSKKLPPMEGKAQVDDILKMIFPPRAMTYENKDYVQNISTE